MVRYRRKRVRRRVSRRHVVRRRRARARPVAAVPSVPAPSLYERMAPYAKKFMYRLGLGFFPAASSHYAAQKAAEAASLRDALGHARGAAQRNRTLLDAVVGSRVGASRGVKRPRAASWASQGPLKRARAASIGGFGGYELP